MITFISHYRESAGVTGGGGNIQAISAHQALSELMEKHPGKKSYAVESYDWIDKPWHQSVCKEDWPPTITDHWQKVSISNIYPFPLPQHFMGWRDGKYIEYSDIQKDLIRMRREVWHWAKDTPSPTGAWLAVYRCGINDWDMAQTLHRISPENQAMFISFASGVQQLLGQRKDPPYTWLNELGWIERFKEKREAEEELAKFAEFLRKNCILWEPTLEVYDGENVTMPYVIHAPSHIGHLLEETRNLRHAHENENAGEGDLPEEPLFENPEDYEGIYEGTNPFTP